MRLKELLGKVTEQTLYKVTLKLAVILGIE